MSRENFSLAVLSDNLQVIDDLIKGDSVHYDRKTIRAYFPHCISFTTTDEVREYLFNACGYTRGNLPKDVHAILYDLMDQHNSHTPYPYLADRIKFLIEIGTDVNCTIPLGVWNEHFALGRDKDLFSMITFYYPGSYDRKGFLCSLLLKYGFKYEMFRRHPCYAQIYSDYCYLPRLHPRVIQVQQIYRYYMIYYRIFPYVVATQRGLVPQDFARVLISFFVPYLK